MRGSCYNCRSEQDLSANPPRVLLHALPQLGSPLEVDVPFTCTTCGREVGNNIRFESTNKRFVLTGPPQPEPAAERKLGRIWGLDRRASTFFHYQGATPPGGNVLFPLHEGTVSGGHAIGRHGDPDLMAEFSAEYLKQYKAIFPAGRLPRTLTEMMPGLHLLVNAAEPALKADLIRSGRPSGGHGLSRLYRQLEEVHRVEMETRFADAGPNANLKVLGVEGPTVESVFAVYERSFGGGPVYMETRYFAEPTTMLKSDSLKGGNLVKQTPYPIFLPVVVRTMLDVYDHFSGAERLKRMGGDVAHGSRDPGNDQHGDWGLVPSSLDLVVVRVAQQVAWDEHHADREVFSRFKAARPPGYSTSWMYGGQSLLFYRAGNSPHEDGEAVIDGLECKVWYDGRLGMHARDLYLLADLLEAPDGLTEMEWTNRSPN